MSIITWVKQHTRLTIGVLILFTYLSVFLLSSYTIHQFTDLSGGNAAFTLNITSPDGALLSQKPMMPAWAFPLIFIKPTLIGLICGYLITKGD